MMQLEMRNYFKHFNHNWNLNLKGNTGSKLWENKRLVRREFKCLSMCLVLLRALYTCYLAFKKQRNSSSPPNTSTSRNSWSRWSTVSESRSNWAEMKIMLMFKSLNGIKNYKLLCQKKKKTPKNWYYNSIQVPVTSISSKLVHMARKACQTFNSLVPI